jgi:glycosyltransferase involved in cell wall biosynthesis
VRRLWATRSGRRCLPGRALDYATFCGSAFGALLASARPGDVILAKTDPPLLSVAAWAAARVKGARLVTWCQDLFPEVAAAIGLGFAAGSGGRVLRTLRNASLRGAAMNVAVCERMAERLRAEGIPADRITVIHNWADGSRVRPLAPDDNRLRQQWDLGDHFVIGYSGNLGRVHEVETLVELMDALGDEPELVFLLIGAGAGYQRLKERAGERGLGNLMLRPYQPSERLGESLTAPDLHLVTLRPDCEGLVMPSKLYAALAAGRPVLAIGDPSGDVARIVRAHRAGLVVAPGEAVAAAAAIRALRRDPERLARMGASARAAYEHLYSREASLAAWHQCLHALLQAEHTTLHAVAAE